jgi:hypothetical protein
VPIRFDCDSEAGIVFTRAEGLVTFEDLQNHLAQEAAIEKAAGYAEVFDASGASTNLTAEQVKQLVEHVMSMTNTAPFGPTAIITTDDTFFGMARMIEILCELRGGPRMGVFRTFSAGLEWLRAERAKFPL